MTDEIPAKRGKGRPTKFTAENITTILKGLAIPLTRKGACGAAGIGYEIFRQWIERGEKGPAVENPTTDPVEIAKNQDFVAFLAAVTVAEAQGRALMESRYVRGAKTDWKAAKEYLARRYPDDFGPSGIGADEVTITITGRNLDIHDMNSPVKKDEEK